MSKTKTKKRSFHQNLILNRWLLQFFKEGQFDSLKSRLAPNHLEGIDEDGQTRFFHELTHNLFEFERVSNADLRRYDLNIVQHWKEITARRNEAEDQVLNMKYFQYLSLLFTEIYLDYYFNKRQALLDGLNAELNLYNNEPGAEAYQNYIASDLNKIAFWNATGSGKTLLLHVNIKQYLHYYQSGNATVYPDKIILLTPNEGLSKQHLEEFHLSGFGLQSRLFEKNSPGISKEIIEIIDINKLSDTMGDKTVAVDAFEGNNLVLVDEGHRGTGTVDGAWMQRREVLVSGGFAFEYSATFGQAVAKGATVLKAEEDIQKKKAKMFFETTSLKSLTDIQRASLSLDDEEKKRARLSATREVYAKCILFDYSYKYFYADGYGKESVILNMTSDAYEVEDNAQKYFTACLLSFYQQTYIWHKNNEKLFDFNIEKPLWVFVGHSVQSASKPSSDDSNTMSDVMQVLMYLSFFLNEETIIKRWLKELLTDSAQLLDGQGKNIFYKRFSALLCFSDKVDSLYEDILLKLFNAQSKQRLKLVNLKRSKGELALRVGNAEPFGLISIGDDTGFYKNAADVDGFDLEENEFDNGLFNTINHKNSSLNVLIGSRKFTEGWSSWRVSTMGLLNLGQGEGSQIIQLFGRGVRLKGKNYSLKRTEPNQRPKGLHLEYLETLNIFGVRANYMATFKDYLKEEGVTPSDEIIVLDFPTQSNLPTCKLKTLGLKDGYKDNQKLGFKRQHFPWLFEIPSKFKGKIKPPHVTLDLYPRIEALSTKQIGYVAHSEQRHQGKLNQDLFAFFDFDRIYSSIQNYKQQRSWSNLRLDYDRLLEFCKSEEDWYTLYMPRIEFNAYNFKNIKRQEDILISLLCDYTERFYNALKNAYEGQFYEVINIVQDNGSMLKLYHFEIEDTDDGLEYLAKLEELKSIVAKKKLGAANLWNANHMVAISFDRHLFYPLISISEKATVPLKMRPLAFDSESEVQFVNDLQAFYQSEQGKDILSQKSLYLLRNADSKNKGVGFALAGNFYPDFLLWLVDDKTGEQWLSFIDPKGLKHMDLSHPKLSLYQEIKKIEQQLNGVVAENEPKLTLNSFILSPTNFKDLLNINATTQAELERRHILFMDDGWKKYLVKMFGLIN